MEQEEFLDMMERRETVKAGSEAMVYSDLMIRWALRYTSKINSEF